MSQPRFVEGNLFRHTVVMSVTASVGLMALFVVDLVNMVYVSWLGDPVLTAAVGYGSAVMFFLTAVGIGLSIGVSALVARAVGAHDRALARRRATEGLVLSGLIGVAVAALVLPLLPWAVATLGAEGRVATEALHFLRLSLPGMPFLILGMVGAAVLRAHGRARDGMMVTVWGAAVLAALDPVLILWAGWDLTGAALAGWGSRLTMAVMALVPVARLQGGFSPVTAGGLRWAAQPLLAISAPAMLTQLATPVGQAIVTRLVAGHGPEAVAGMTIAGRLTPVAFALIFALSGAMGPIISQNLGAGKMQRVRRSFLDAILFMGMVIAGMSGLLYLARPVIAALFQAEGLTHDILYLFCGPLSLLFFFNGLIFVANAACNNLGAALQSTAVNWARHTLGTLPFAVWLGAIYGAEGVLIGQSVGGVVFGLLAIWLAWRVVRQRTA